DPGEHGAHPADKLCTTARGGVTTHVTTCGNVCPPAVDKEKAAGYDSGVTSTSILATTSGCSRTETVCVPTVLMCAVGSSTRRRSSVGPPADLTASTTSVAVTEP